MQIELHYCKAFAEERAVHRPAPHQLMKTPTWRMHLVRAAFTLV